MNVVGLITEYNPFHKGHEYHIQQARKRTRADYLVVIMSGNFVQRGTPAIIDKFTRTEMALRCGADLVLELPVCYATGSAEYFAQSAVAHLDALGIINYLCFGSESGNLEQLQKAAHILAKEPPAYREALKQYTSEGIGFPAAMTQALKATAGNTLAALLENPNNILGIEYLKALEQQHSKIKPITITRQGAGYHQRETDELFSSATALRQIINTLTTLNSPDDVVSQLEQSLKDGLPTAAFSLLERSLGNIAPITLNDFSSILHYRLLQCQSAFELTAFADISSDLAERIWHTIPRFTDYENFVIQLKTKHFTDGRIRRCLLHLLLNIKTTDLTATAPHYLRILGFNRESSPLLAAIKEHGKLPLITKLADTAKFLSGPAQAALEKDIFASHIYQGIVTQKNTGKPYNEYRRQLIIL